MDYRKTFNSMYPGFFHGTGIKVMPESWVFTELVMDLRTDAPKPLPYAYPESISFGEYHGDIGKLKKAVGQVDEDWVPYFDGQSRVFCAFDGDTIASFCILSDWGRHDGLRIGGPGCVGTVPEYRKRGIGLEMVRRATEVTKEDGYDLSWIHYTHVGHWYEKIGYQTVLRWNSKGFMPT